MFTQIVDDFEDTLLNAVDSCVQNNLRINWLFVRSMNAREVFYFALPGHLVKPFDVPLFAHLQWCLHEHFNKLSAGFFVGLTHPLPILQHQLLINISTQLVNH